jgi:hypothetical protein
VQGDPGDERDDYALVADAAANAVWKVAPNHQEENPDELLDVTVFVAWPDSGNPPEDATEEELEEFFRNPCPRVRAHRPDMDEQGHIYVGGLGSEVPGAASVVECDGTGTLIQQWDGFTEVTGLAVAEDHVYVSQLFGGTPPQPPGDSPTDEAPPMPTGAPGSVVRADRHDPESGRVEVMVPYPAGLAADKKGRVFAAVNSIAPAEGVQDLFGPDSLDLGGGPVCELDFTDATPVPEVPGEGPGDGNGELT